MFLSSLCFLPTSWLVTSSGVPDPSFHMSVSGTLGCFLGENNSKGFFLEPVSVAPSLRVFSLKGFDLLASVRALAEIASGGFETDFNGVFLLFRCDMCDLTRFGSCPYGGLTLPGSCPCFEFLFVDAMLAALPVRCALWPDPVWVLPLWWLDPAWVLPLFSVFLRVLDDCCVASPPRLLPVTVWVLPLMWFYFVGSEYYAPCLCVLVAGCS